MPIAKLNRSVLRLSGNGVQDWFSGLITNSLSGPITFAALLTPQGKIIADFFVIKDKDDLLVDTAAKFGDLLTRRLAMYKLRAPITIEATDMSVHAAWGGIGSGGYTDPRHPDLGQRIYGTDLSTEETGQAYNVHRLELGIPDSEFDFETLAVFPANVNMDYINGVDFKKGCFIGQEVVSRMYRKTEVKKRMRAFKYTGALTKSEITQNARMVGDIMHKQNGYGMAMMRLGRLVTNLADDPKPLMVGDTEIQLLDLLYGHSA